MRGLVGRRPYLALGVVGFVLLSSLALLELREGGRLRRLSLSSTVSLEPAASCDPDPPANWDKLYKWEDELPQHNVDLPSPEGRAGRYVYFKNQIQMLGWNNQLNEVLLNTHLAYKSNRTYVFHDYVWKIDYYPWDHHPQRLDVPRTPVNALISGPSAGGPWGPGDNAPRAISLRFLDQVCPPEERRIINTRDVKPPIYWSPGDVVFNTWQKLLYEAPERCIEVQGATIEEDRFSQTFDLWFWGTTRALDVWEDFSKSPVSQLLRTSPIIQSAVDNNEYLFQPRAPRHLVPKGATNDAWDRTLAIHIRRGDYKEACMGLAQWNSTFYSWNLHTFLPDHFNHPPGWDVDRDLTVKTYLEHCYPDEDKIMEKIRKSRADYIAAAKPGEVRYLDTAFILTNDKSDFLERLKKRLREDEWYNVVTTRDLELTQHQKDVGMAVDMDMARKAAVFIGNGWSSFTSNIVHRRLIDGKEPISIRFF
ncbi:hypothetical protein CPB83DRAFT_859388 [Crepidotus variabilis]|uniref:Uncharacterized protein n=1 Tax=Crepidotus variabilis TaxID=179855 RepID=A0A9P6JM91_9AGAR|nr:hypothetical protein CPB83DRAFT_859388 [Crepidotus variabilis]